MQTVFTIVIADRNPHVRSFLQREMSQEGCRIRLAESARALLECAGMDETVHLIILDPDLPDAVGSHLLQTLKARTPAVPVVIHTNYPNTFTEKGEPFILVEKGGSSVERLKQIAATFRRH